jgi:hypothetical protein
MPGEEYKWFPFLYGFFNHSLTSFTLDTNISIRLSSNKYLVSRDWYAFHSGNNKEV